MRQPPAKRTTPEVELCVLHRAGGRDVPGSGRIFNPPLQRGWSCVQSPDCLARRSRRADVGIGPYEKSGNRAVGADCISAHAHPCGERNHRTPARIENLAGTAIQAAPAKFRLSKNLAES